MHTKYFVDNILILLKQQDTCLFPATNGGSSSVSLTLQANRTVILPLEFLPPLQVMTKYTAQPTFISITNVLRFIILNNFHQLFFLHTSTVEGSRLCKSPEYSSVHNNVSLLKPSNQPSDALKSLTARLVVMHEAFSLQQWANDHHTASCSLFKPYSQHSLQVLKWWLFQALPLTKQSATLWMTHSVSVLFITKVFNVDSAIPNVAASATCFLTGISCGQNVHCSSVQNSFLFSGSLIVIKKTHCNHKLKWNSLLV